MLSIRSRARAALQHSIRTPRVLVTVGVLTAGVVLAPVATAAPDAHPQTPSADGLLADPGDPTTAADAGEAWVKATEAAEAMNEKVLVAIDREHAVRAKAEAAARTVTAKEQALAAARRDSARAAAAATAADRKVAAAAAVESRYQAQVDDFADASFRGVRLGSVSALLTAESPDDFLERASTLDVVADDVAGTLDRSAAAKAAATAARTDAQRAADDAAAAQVRADTAVTEAQTAKTDADAALQASHRATEDVRTQQAALQSEADRLHTLQNRLSEQERQAALARQAAAAEAAAAQAQARADRDRVAPQAPAAPQSAAAPQSPAADAAGTPASSAAPSSGSSESSTPSAAAPAPSGAAEIAVQAALSKVGSPYVFGAAGPDSFDCSGLTSWAYAQAGITIPRTSSGQAELQYVPLDQLQPGDLVTYYSPVHHVGMYIGNGQIVHASTSSKPVYVASVYYGGPNPTGHRVVG